MKSYGFLAVPAVIGLGISGSASAAVVSFQQGASNALTANYTGTGDTEMFGYSSSLYDWNNGAVNETQLGTENAGDARRTLLRFDDLNVMAGQYTSINSVTLTLTQALNHPTRTQFDVGIYQISNANAAWVEGTQTYATAASGEPTWNNRAHSGTPWAGSAGLSTVGTDYNSTVLDTETYTYVQGTQMNFALPTALIDQWITGGINAGLLVRMVNENIANAAGTIYTSEDGTQINRPMLTIDYTPIPEPSTLALFGLVGWMGVRRRQ